MSPRITKISPQERTADRVNVFLDGEFAFGLGAMLAAERGLTVGDELTTEKVEALRGADDVGKATDAALNLLARRPRSTREVRDRLRRKEFSPETIDAALAKLAGWRYLDDADFARYWVDNRETHKPRGRRLLELELRQKGVERDVIRQTIADTELDERAAALALGRTKIRTYHGLEPAIIRRRLGSYLVRRGYGFDVVKPVLDQLLGEAVDAESDDVE